MHDGADTLEALEVRWTLRPHLLSLTILAVFLVGNLASWAGGWHEPWLAGLGTVVLGSIIVLGGADAWHRVRAGWFLRLDHHGVTLRAGHTVPWADLTHVRVTGARPRWWLALLEPFSSSVGFVPRPGVQLPTLLAPGRPRTRVADWSHRAMFHTTLAFSPSLTSVTSQQVVDAVRAFSDLHVHDLRDHPAAP